MTDGTTTAAPGLTGRTTRVAAALALAMTAAVVSLVPARTTTLLLGRPGDARQVSGMSSPDQHLGHRGRWTRGDGRLTLPAVGLPADLVMQVAVPDERVPDTIEITTGAADSRRVTLGTGWNVVSVPVGTTTRGPRGSGLGHGATEQTLRVRSLTSGPDDDLRGVFVERVDLVVGGWSRLASMTILAWIQLVAIFLGLITFAGVATAVPRERPRTALAVTAVAVAGTMAFLPAVAAHLWATALACWFVTAVAWGASNAPGRAVAAWPTWRVAVLVTLAFVGLLALLLPGVMSGGRVLSQADMMFEFYPWRSAVASWYRDVDRPPLGDIPMMVYPFAVFAKAKLAAGVFPTWTSAIGAGQPFLGTFQSALLSPFTWLLAVLPLPQAFNAIAVSRLLVGGLGMFLFLRAIGLSRWSSAFGGTAFLLNPFVVVWLEHPLAGVTAWLPWMLLVGERFARPRASLATSAGLLALVTALVLSGGHPHTGAFTAMLGGGYTLAAATSTARRRHALPVAAAALVLGIAVVAVQALPFLEYLSLSRGLSIRQGFPLNPFFAPRSTLITTLVPNFMGHHSSGNYWGPLNYLEQQIYPGLAVWLLAPVGLVAADRRWRVWFFAAAALLGFLVLFAAPGVHQLVSLLPLIKSASLTRVPGVTLASLIVVAAFGLDAVLGSEDDDAKAANAVESPSRRAVTVIVGVTAAIWLVVAAALLVKSPFLSQKGLWPFVLRWTVFAAWMTALVTPLAVARLRRRVVRSAAAIGIVAALALDLLLFGYGFHDTVPADQVFPVVPEIAAAQQDRGVFRVLGLQQALLPNAAMAYGLQDVRSYDGLGVARYDDLLDVVLRGDGFLHHAVSITSPLIDLLNVKYVFALPDSRPPDGWFVQVTEGEAPLYRNTRVFPRAFLVDGYVVRDGNDARRTLRDGLVDFRRFVLLEQDPPAPERPAIAAAPGEIGTAAMTTYDDERVVIQTDAPGARLLVLTDTHYPGWQASVDGVAVPIYRANFAFRAVPVPAGRHDVVFEYRSPVVRLGAIISAVAACVLMGVLLAGAAGRGRA